jgi:hypothetical protein
MITYNHNESSLHGGIDAHNFIVPPSRAIN